MQRLDHLQLLVHQAAHLPFVEGQTWVGRAERNDVANAQFNTRRNAHERMLIHHGRDLARAHIIALRRHIKAITFKYGEVADLARLEVTE